jgi:hypothetical protein
LKAKLAEVKVELRRRMHKSIPEVGKWLGTVGPEFDKSSKENIPVGLALPKQATGFELAKLLRQRTFGRVAR